jgi:hypothetical protein
MRALVDQLPEAAKRLLSDSAVIEPGLVFMRAKTEGIMERQTICTHV